MNSQTYLFLIIHPTFAQQIQKTIVSQNSFKKSERSRDKMPSNRYQIQTKLLGLFNGRLEFNWVWKSSVCLKLVTDHFFT